MSLQDKLSKLFKDPVGVMRRRVTAYLTMLRYAQSSGYKAEAYWRDRHKKYGFDLRGVGDYTMTPEENQKILDEGGRLFLSLCQKENIHLPTVSMLDVGCGTGYFAGIFRSAGGTTYQGVDIVDILFEGLRKKFPDFGFGQLDVSSNEIRGTYDLIILMDVAQHITDEIKFRFAMENLKSHLNDDGTIIISTSVGPYKRHSFYFVSRPMEVFESLFPAWRFSEPLPFSGNRMFSIRRR